MDDTPNLKLPYIMAAQAQKHVTHNEAIRALDALVQLAVKDKDLATPPATPADGDRYIVALAATGAWSGHSGRIAAWQDGAWEIYAPAAGWRAWVTDENALYAFDGAAWITASGGGGSINPAPLVGVNATADATNRLAVASPATLFSHEGGDHQLKINKAAATDTATVLFQTGFSGRAEFGLAGDDDWHVKVSPDGAAWREAIVVDRTTGEVSMPYTSMSDGGARTATPAGRLTLVSGTPVMTTTVAPTGTLHYTPFAGETIGLFDGAEWRLRTFTEISLALSTGTASRLHDVFAFWTGSTVALELAAWTDDTTRAAALARQDGRLVKSSAPTRLYLGSIYLDGARQARHTFGSAAAGGGAAVFDLWNGYHRTAAATAVRSSSASWSYETEAWRAAEGSATYRCTMVLGLPGVVRASYQGAAALGFPATEAGIGIARNGTAPHVASAHFTAGDSGNRTGLHVSYAELVPAGRHTVQAVENGTAGAVFHGASGKTLSGLLVELEM